MDALLIVDIQYDFLPGGSLGVPKGDIIIPVINRIQQKFDLVLATQDWHPSNHMSFASNHPGKKVFEVMEINGDNQILWPDHCVQGSPGAEISKRFDIKKIEAIFRKGMDPEIDSYSAFFDNGHKKSTGLAGYFKEKEVSRIFMCGLAQDFCVYFSAKDALMKGFQITIIEDAVKPIDISENKKKMKELTDRSVKIISSAELEGKYFGS